MIFCIISKTTLDIHLSRSFLHGNSSSGFKSCKRCQITPKEEGCADGWVGTPSCAAVPSLLPSADPTFEAALKNLTSIRDISSGPSASLSVFFTKQLSQINLK